MSNDSSWDTFYKSGRVDDYLHYRGLDQFTGFGVNMMLNAVAGDAMNRAQAAENDRAAVKKEDGRADNNRRPHSEGTSCR